MAVVINEQARWIRLIKHRSAARALMKLDDRSVFRRDHSGVARSDYVESLVYASFGSRIVIRIVKLRGVDTGTGSNSCLTLSVFASASVIGPPDSGGISRGKVRAHRDSSRLRPEMLFHRVRDVLLASDGRSRFIARTALRITTRQETIRISPCRRATLLSFDVLLLACLIGSPIPLCKLPL